MLIPLLFIGIILIIFNIKAIKKEEKSFDKAFKDAEFNTDEIDVKFGELRREFSETILELQQEILELKEKYDVKYNEKDYDNILEEKLELLNMPIIKEKSEEEQNESINLEELKKETKEETLENNIKIQQIKELFEEKLSIEEIVEKSGLGKGEILLIKELYLK